MDQVDLAGLLRRCLECAPEAEWDVFMRLAQPVIAGGVLRSASRWAKADRELVNDLIQQTFVKICEGNFRILRDFRSGTDAALCVYLRTIASSVVIDHFRSASTLKKNSGRTEANLDEIANSFPAPDGQIDALERKQLLERVEKCLDGQEPRNRRIFLLYYRLGLTPKAIAALPGMNLGSGGVETVIYRLTKGVRECLQRAGVLQPAKIREGGRA